MHHVTRLALLLAVLPLAAFAEDEHVQTGLGWSGQVVASNHYTLELGGVHDTYDTDVTYTVEGLHYTAEGRTKYVSYVPPSAGNPGWVRITLEGTVAQTAELDVPMAIVDVERRGGVTPPLLPVTLTKTTEGLSETGERIHLVEAVETTLPDMMVESGELFDLPTNGHWTGSHTPAPPDSHEAAAQFRPWTLSWDLHCTADCIRN